MAGLEAVLECLEDLQKLGLEDLLGNLSALTSTEMEGKKQSAVKDPLTKVERQERKKLNSSELKPMLLLEEKRKTYRELPVLAVEEHRKISHSLRASSSGVALCLAVSSQQVAVGGDQGRIQLFRLDGKRLKALSHSKKGDMGAICCMSYCEDGSLLAAGDALGHVVLWDVEQEVPLCTSSAQCQSPLLQIRLFRAGTIYGFFSQSDGSIVEFTYLRSMVFDLNMQQQALDLGEQGVCAVIAPLPDSPSSHPLSLSQITAFGFPSSVVIFAFAPNQTRLAQIPVLKSPYLSWSWYQADPILGIGHLTSISVYRLRGSAATCIGQFSLPSELLCLHITPCGKTLAIDHLHDLHVLSTHLFPSDSLLSDCENPHFEVVKREYDLHSLKIVGNGGEYYHNSTVLSESRLFILGKKRIYVGSIRNWMEIGRQLMAKKSWLESFAYAMDLYADRDNLQLNYQEFHSFAREMTRNYMQLQVLKWENKLPVVVEFCVFVEEIDYLLCNLSQTYIESEDNQAYLACLRQSLEPYIYYNHIKSVPALILGKIIAYYINENNPEAIERLILHLDANSMDMSAVRPYCEQYLLLTAEIYLSTHCADPDFMSPVRVIVKSMQGIEGKKTKLGRKLMWYVRMTLAGNLYPRGGIEKDRYSKVFNQMLNWLIIGDNMQLLLSTDIAALLELLWPLFSNPKLVSHLHTTSEISHSVVLLTLHYITPPEFSICVSVFIGKAAKLVPIRFDSAISLKIARQLMQFRHVNLKPLEQSLVFDSLEQVEAELESCIISVLETCRSLTDSELSELIKLGAETRL